MTGGSPFSHPGDVGRRLGHRRRELGLSVAEVAARAGIDPGYLEYLESQPADVSNSTVVRLAIALDTTAPSLLGSDVDQAPGQTGPGRPGAWLESLTPVECRGLLGQGGVGRIVFDDARGPIALPVNYKMSGDSVVFRTAVLSSVRAATYGRRVGFEVDHIDDALRQGWSVLVTGIADEVRNADELWELQQLGVEPWAGDERPVYVRIKPLRVSGRRIHVTEEHRPYDH